MNKGKEHFFKSPWIISIGTAIFSFLLTFLNDYSKGKPILTTIWAILKWILDLAGSILNYNLKVWWIILFIISAILIIKFIFSLKKENKTELDFHKYTEEKCKKWKWSWEWLWSVHKNAWLISNMQAHCPECDTPLIENSSVYGLSFNCPRCDFRANGEQCDDPHKIQRIILDNIDRQRKNTKR